jgi:hypothetical protein
VAFVEGDLVPFQEAAECLLEGGFLVVVGLVLDVGQNVVRLRLADGDRAIARLPMEGVQADGLGREVRVRLRPIGAR